MTKKKRKKSNKYLFIIIALGLLLLPVFYFSSSDNNTKAFDCTKKGSEFECSWTKCVGQDNVLVLNHETGENRFKIIEKESGSVTFSGLSGKYIPVLICGEKIDMLPSVVF